MGIIYIMIGASIVIALIFLGAYLWAVKDGQFDDERTPSMRILFDDEPDNTNHN